MISLRPPISRPLFLAGILALNTSALFAQTPSSYTWTGLGGDNWTTTANNWKTNLADPAAAAPTASTAYQYVFTGNTQTSVSVKGNTYLFSSILFDENAGAFTLNPFSGLGVNTTDRFALGTTAGTAATLTQNSASDQIVNAALLLNAQKGSLTVGGAGTGSLTLSQIRFSQNNTVAANSPSLIITRNVTLGEITHFQSSGVDNPGILQIGNGATTTFSSAGSLAALSLNLGVNADASPGSATVQATNVAGFTAAGAVTAYDVTFAGDRQMTFSGNFQVLGSGDRTLTVSNTSTEGLTLSGSTIQFGAAGNNSRAVVLDVSSGAKATISGAITGNRSTGSTGLTKTGNGLLTLTGSNSYNGITFVGAGTLLVSGSGSINTSSGITVDGGTLNYSSSVNLATGLNFTKGTLAGSNYTGKTLSIGANQTISPGSSTGTLTSDAQTWASGGTYHWEMNDAAGTAGGNGWDLINITGALAITATADSKFTIDITSLASQGPGQAANFNSLQSGAWMIADAANPIANFDASYFTLNLTNFQNVFNGTWSLALGTAPQITGGDSSQLFLVYTAVPEPQTAPLFVGALAILIVLHRRRAAQISVESAACR